jgi:antitoxin component YwqK of YwqJK toxin-antitoxin module
MIITISSVSKSISTNILNEIEYFEKHGHRNGVFIFCHEHNLLRSYMSTYKNGRLHGLAETYDDSNGDVSSIVMYVWGALEGEHLKFQKEQDEHI